MMANMTTSTGEEGTRQRQAGADPLECAKCSMWYLGHSPFIVEAAASVAIEHGMSTAAMLRSYIAGYHNRGHQELPAGQRLG